MAYRDHNLGKLLKLANTEGLQQADAAQGLDEGFTVCSTGCHYRSEGVGIELEQHTCSARPIDSTAATTLLSDACDIGSRIWQLLCYENECSCSTVTQSVLEGQSLSHAVYISLASHNQQVARMMHIRVTPSANVRKVQYAQ